MGTRLNPMTNTLPKCLISVGGELLIDRQIAALQKVGVEEFIVVTGHREKQVRRHLDDRAKCISNPDFKTTNSINSLYMAREELVEDMFLLNCDLVFHSEILNRMLESGKPNVIAVDSFINREPGEMNVEINGKNQITEISKDLDPNKSHAQSVQIVKFSAEGAVAIRDSVTQLILSENKDAFPTLAFNTLINSGELYAQEVGDLPWGEIDCPSDYKRVEREVIPQIIKLS